MSCIDKPLMNGESVVYRTKLHWVIFLWPRMWCVVALCLSGQAAAEMPVYRIENGSLQLENVSAECPIIYDNDWWKDVPDAAYLWMKTSQGHAKLRGNIVTRDMWDWQNGYQYKIEQGLAEAQALLRAAQESGLKGIPEPVLGANAVLMRPSSGKIEETQFETSVGSNLIVTEARKASRAKPLLLFVGGPCTTVATAYLAAPEIADRVVVFQVDGGAYNGKDGWSWHIVQTRLRFANWARGYSWGSWSNWNPARFDSLPLNALGDTIRKYANSDLGKANQWGDGAWIFHLYEPRIFTKVEEYDGTAITIPRDGTNVSAIENEFFKTMQASPRSRP